LAESEEGLGNVRRVLVIDDQDVARDYMTRLLEDAGYNVASQSSPLGVTRQVIREGITVVIIDVEMPALRGDKLVRLFRQNRRLANLGLVLVSSKDQEELAALGRAAGADAVVTKKNLDRALVAEVKKLFGR
jgi:CheY-like chemotaxis protein